MKRTLWLPFLLVSLTVSLCGQCAEEINLTGGAVMLKGPVTGDGEVTAVTSLTAPGYTITQVTGVDPSNVGIATSCNPGTGGCTPSQISTTIKGGFGIIGFPPNGGMAVNGQNFGMWDFPGFIAATFSSSVGTNGALTISGDASGYGSFNECDTSGSCSPIPNELCFLFGKTQWQYVGQFVPDTDPGSQGTYDFSFININTSGKSPTTTTLSSSLNPSVYGQKVTWTATVTTSGPIAPTGKVRFTWDSYTIGSGALNANGTGTLSRRDLNADPYPLIANYQGDANNAPSSSAIVNQVITHTTSAAVLTSSSNPSTQGQAVTFVAKITSPTTVPKGPVTFSAGKTVLGTVELSGGEAAFTTATLPVGSTTVTATLPWNSDISGSSASVTQKVQQ